MVKTLSQDRGRSWLQSWAPVAQPCCVTLSRLDRAKSLSRAPGIKAMALGKPGPNGAEGLKNLSLKQPVPQLPHWGKAGNTLSHPRSMSLLCLDGATIQAGAVSPHVSV